jgi:hypothetical protein
MIRAQGLDDEDMDRDTRTRALIEEHWKAADRGDADPFEAPAWRAALADPPQP